MRTSSEALLQALEDERRYVARELHDGVAQTTLQLSLQISICSKLLERGQQEMLTGELAELEQRIQLAATQIRAMIADMRPPKVEPEAELDDYLRHMIDVHLERGGCPVEPHLDLTSEFSRLSSLQSLALARIVQEGLLNTRKHAAARQVRLTVSNDETNFYIKIWDDGSGFDPAEVESRPTDKGGAGLANLRARATALNGTLTVDSGSQGTEITVSIPIKSAREPGR